MTKSRIYTKTGDDGTIGLLYDGCVPKSDELVDAYGDIDEAVAALGAARAALEPRLARIVLRLQREMFAAAADLAASRPVNSPTVDAWHMPSCQQSARGTGYHGSVSTRHVTGPDRA